MSAGTYGLGPQGSATSPVFLTPALRKALARHRYEVRIIDPYAEPFARVSQWSGSKGCRPSIGNGSSDCTATTRSATDTGLPRIRDHGPAGAACVA